MVQRSPYVYNDSQYVKRVVLRVAGNKQVLFDQVVLSRETVPIFIRPESLSCGESLEVAIINTGTRLTEDSFQTVSGNLCKISSEEEGVLTVRDYMRSASFEEVPVDFE